MNQSLTPRWPFRCRKWAAKASMLMKARLNLGLTPGLVLACVVAGISAAMLASGPSLSATHEESQDTRRPILLDPAEREMILLEMRQFLQGVEAILRALKQDDMKAVALSARSLGRQATHQMPPALMQRLPEEFRKLGFSVHSAFDQMALDAESLADPGHTLGQLTDILARCNACHAGFKLGMAAH